MIRAIAAGNNGITTWGGIASLLFGCLTWVARGWRVSGRATGSQTDGRGIGGGEGTYGSVAGSRNEVSHPGRAGPGCDYYRAGRAGHVCQSRLRSSLGLYLGRVLSAAAPGGGFSRPRRSGTGGGLLCPAAPG